MTAICVASGPSHPKAGVVDYVVDAAGFTSLLSAIPDLAFLLPVSAVLGVAGYHLPTFCASDPPGFPTFTGAEIFAFIIHDLGPDYYSFIAKAQQVEGTLVWYQFCECVSGAQPTQPAPPAAPADAPTLSGPVAQPNNAACATYHGVPSFTSSFGPPLVQTPQPPPYPFNQDYDFVGTAGGGGGGPYFGVRLPTNASSYTITWTRTTSGASAGGVWRSFMRPTGFFSGVENQIGTAPQVNVAHGAAPVTQTYQLVAGQIGLAIDGLILTSNTTDLLAVDVKVYCGGSQGAPIQPCCPPDQSMLLVLNQINTAVQLMQRQIAPFAYILGESDSGLSGNGSIGVQGILGVKVDITTAPDRLGLESGEPIAIWEAGWINIGTPDGYGPRHFITSDPFVLMPVSGAATVIGYSIPDDVTVTITQLVREA